MKQNQGEVELSRKYFEICPELLLIQQPFDVKNVKKQLQRRDFDSQFKLVKEITQTKNHKLKLRMNSVIQNKKNRFSELSIYQHNRVILPSISKQQHSTYINASWINLNPSKKMVMTQAPLQTTESDFQLMLKHQKIQCVIMLCNIIQGGKVRCFDYYSSKIKQTIKQIDDYMTVAKVQLPTNQSNQPFDYIHIHYSQWPDKEVPNNTNHIKVVIEQALKYDRIAIHCSAGLGRSGVLASAMLLQLAARGGEKVSVFGTVRRLREYRFGAIQNNTQYKFIYDYLCEIRQTQQ